MTIQHLGKQFVPLMKKTKKSVAMFLSNNILKIEL